MTFSTLVYERNHGSSHDYLDHTVFSPGGMTLTEAKKWARLHASDVRSPLAVAMAARSTVVVMP